MPKHSTLSTSAIKAILAERGQIAIIWGTDDVQQKRPDLSDDQAWEVLQQCLDRHDCNFGMTWDLIESTADALFPQCQRSRGIDPPSLV